jgi:hypothetical protein
MAQARLIRSYARFGGSGVGLSLATENQIS